MTRILTVPWPDARLFARRNGAPVRLLAVSDEVDPALEHAANRDAIGRLDAIVGCGDLEPSYLCFLADAFGVPVAYVRGNHDRGGLWADPSFDAPRHLVSGSVVDVDGITVAALEWPGLEERQTRRDESRAWRDVIHVSCVLGLRGLRGRSAPVLVLSHAPPRGVGDRASDPYHVGYRGYRWLLERLRPPLWLHGHTTRASVPDWRAALGTSIVANVTGSVLVELVPPEVGTGR